VVSIAGLEHCVLRAPMSRPRSLASKVVLPRSKEYAFALKTPDPRINFALTAGSVSCPTSVPIYTAETLDAQLDQTAARFLSSTVRIRLAAHGVAVTLPKVLDWFARDFGGSKLGAARAAVRAMRSCPSPGVGDEASASLALLDHAESALAAEAPTANISFSPFAFVCSHLTQYSSAALGGRPSYGHDRWQVAT